MAVDSSTPPIWVKAVSFKTEEIRDRSMSFKEEADRLRSVISMAGMPFSSGAYRAESVMELFSKLKIARVFGVCVGVEDTRLTRGCFDTGEDAGGLGLAHPMIKMNRATTENMGILQRYGMIFFLRLWNEQPAEMLRILPGRDNLMNLILKLNIKEKYIEI